MPKVKAEQWFTRDNLRRILLWAQSGYTDKEIASLMRIGHTTFYRWREEHAVFRDTLTRGRALACDKVEDELFARCQGRVQKLTEDIKIRRVEYDPMTGNKLREFEEIEPVEKEIYVPADVRAQIYFLNNRRPEDWGDKRTVELGDKAADALRQPSLTLEERKALLSEMQSMIAPLADGELGEFAGSPNGSSPGKRRGTAPSSGK